MTHLFFVGFSAVVEEARFSRTQHGNAMLVDSQNYCYMINRKKERRIYWNCHQRNHKCKGTAITEGFFIVRKGGEHNHQAYPPPRNRYTENSWKNWMLSHDFYCWVSYVKKDTHVYYYKSLSCSSGNSCVNDPETNEIFILEINNSLSNNFL